MSSSNFEFVGVWKLKEFLIKKTGQNESERWRGGAATGSLIYTDCGHMSVSINSSKNSTNETDKYNNCLFYSGTYEAEGNKIIHRVENASNPDRIGETLFRQFKLESDSQLLLIGEGNFGSASLRWCRSVKK